MFGLIAGFIQKGGVLGVALLMLVETIVPVIPSELIMPMAGFEAAQGAFSPVWAVIAGTTGSIIGGALWYAVGRKLSIHRLTCWAERAAVVGSPSPPKGNPRTRVVPALGRRGGVDRVRAARLARRNLYPGWSRAYARLRSARIYLRAREAPQTPSSGSPPFTRARPSPGPAARPGVQPDRPALNPHSDRPISAPARPSAVSSPAGFRKPAHQTTPQLRAGRASETLNKS